MPCGVGAWHDRGVPHRRIVTPVLPAEIATHDGLAYSLWLPAAGTIHGGVVILHGAGSCKESHHDFARALLPPGIAALSFDQRGHGASDGPMDAAALADIAAMVSLLRDRIGLEQPIALRGSSMGGYFALVAAGAVGARAVVAICPASASGLQRGLAAETLRFDADPEALARLLSEHDLEDAVSALDIPVLLLHAEGDEQVPVQHSRELEQHLAHPASRLIVVPGGHHRSIQHDEELQAVSLRFLERSLR
jgi:pimeloyl-ACP methyl ester carboxylesterase